MNKLSSEPELSYLMLTFQHDFFLQKQIMYE